MASHDRPRLVAPGPDETALQTVAAQQGGAWTRTQARQVGYSPARIRRAYATIWARPYRGVYVERARLDAAEDGERHRLLTAARVLSSDLDAVASHRTAALLHGLPLLGRPPAVPILSRAPSHDGDSSSSRYLKVAGLPEGTRTVCGGVPTTSLARTVCDVGRTASRREAVVALDAALRRGLDPGELAAVARLCRSWPGGRRLLRAIELADGRADSPLESLTRLTYRELGLPAPLTQVEVIAPDGEVIAWVDFAFIEQGVVGEADGMLKYDAPGALRAEKRRETNLRRCRLEVLRNSWDDVFTKAGRGRFGREAAWAFEQASGRTVLPGVTFRQVSLRELQERDRRLRRDRAA